MRPSNAGLERLARSCADRVDHRRQPFERFLIDGLSKRLRGKAAQQLLGVPMAFLGVAGDSAGEELCVVRREGPVTLVKRSLDGYRVQPQCQRPHTFLAGRQRLDLERQMMRAGLPVAVHIVAIGFPILAAVFLPEGFLSIHLEDEPALVVVEHPIDEPLRCRQVDNQPVMAGMLGLEHGGDGRCARNRRARAAPR